MIFGLLRVDEAEGATLAHSVRAGKLRLAKGTVLDATAIERLRESGVEDVEAALPELGDISEDEAARRCASALTREGSGLTSDAPGTGRVNLRAAHDGVVSPDVAAIDRLNAIDPRLTIATLPEGRAEAGELVATVKVIPFHAPSALVERWELAAHGDEALSVRAWKPLRVAHVSTELPALKPSTMDKTRTVLAGRLAGTAATFMDEVRVPHRRAELAAALGGMETADLVLVFGASAVTDAADVVPAAIERAGGRVERVGMPVDPGNLLVLARLGEAVVLGAPGCARSPARNGFDIVLDRVLAGVPVTHSDISRMGVGGLLKEIPSRPRPREGG